MESLSPQVVAAAKLLILNLNEFDLWKISIEQYFLMRDYSLWEVILNGDSPTPTRIVDGVVQVIAPTTAGQRLAKKNELKAKGFSVVPSVYASSSKASVSTLLNVDNLSDVVIYFFLQMVMLTMRAMRFLQRTERNLGANGTTAIGFDMSMCDGVGSYDWSFQAKKEPTNYALMEFTFICSSSSLGSDNEVAPGLESVEARLVVYQQNENVFEEDIKLLKLDVMLRDNALVELRKKCKQVEKERDELKLTLEKFQTSSKNLSKLLESQITDKTSLGYDSHVFNRQVFDCDDMNSSESDDSMPTTPVHDRYKSGEGYHVVPPLYTGTFMPPKIDLVFSDAPNASETVLNVTSDSEDESEPESVSNQKEPSFVYTSKHVKTPRASVKTIQVSHDLGPQKTLSFFFDVQGFPQQALKDKGYIAFGGNPKGGKITGKDTECVVLSSDFKLPDENHVLLRVSRENNMYNVDLKNVVPLGDLTCLFAKAILDESNLWHRRLRHINFKTMNKLVKGNLVRGSLSKVFKNNYTFVACEKGKQHRASCKGKIKIGKLDFDDVYFVKELKFNLFNVLQMVPRENNMYNVDLKNVVP
nr:hypothetical protein [Tanacetum cinerariifolium]